MASKEYLREQFRRLQTEEERQMFCLKIIDQELWSRSEVQKDLLPESFINDLRDKLRAALTAEGRVDLVDRFEQALTQAWERKTNRPASQG